MNSPELSPIEGESRGREIMVSGEALEKAIWCLQELGENIDLVGKSLEDLEDLVFQYQQRAFQSETRKARDHNIQVAQALMRVESFCRPNNSIRAVERDEEGHIKGLKVEIEELEAA